MFYMAIWLSCAQNLKLPYLYVLVLLHSALVFSSKITSENAKYKKLLNIKKSLVAIFNRESYALT